MGMILSFEWSQFSRRMWHSLTGHFLGFFGQSKPWHLSNEMLIPPSPVQPQDISEVSTFRISYAEAMVVLPKQAEHMCFVRCLLSSMQFLQCGYRDVRQGL